MNEALRRTPLAFATTNLLQPIEPEGKDAHRAGDSVDYPLMLELGRGQRLARLKDHATATFTTLLQSEAPDELKRTALLELAILAQENNELYRAQNILSQFISRWSDDPSVPDVLLRQGLIYRQMGINKLALAKFYAVMTSALMLKTDRIDYYQRLVLQAQTEIAETQFLLGKYDEAAQAFQRLLKADAPSLVRPEVQTRLIRCLGLLGRNGDLVSQARNYLDRYPDRPEQAEVRFYLAMALKQLGRTDESLQQVLALLRDQQAMAQKYPESLAYWQQRAGNEIGNQMYREGDYLRALEVFTSLVPLDPRPVWQLPVLYQVGLIYERLGQPVRAAEVYGQVAAREAELAAESAPMLRNLIEMARWRKDHLDWQRRAEIMEQRLRDPTAATNTVFRAVASSQPQSP